MCGLNVKIILLNKSKFRDYAEYLIKVPTFNQIKEGNNEISRISYYIATL